MVMNQSQVSLNGAVRWRDDEGTGFSLPPLPLTTDAKSDPIHHVLISCQKLNQKTISFYQTNFLIKLLNNVNTKSCITRCRETNFGFCFLGFFFH